ncbi:MAG: SDR family NAD(P)-dependent oxidoreductase, partial [Pirellulaceae bacterium]|nr:SDR family NAD(P)-dependent oxidoreductase [Pirellulaceae bacterium]
IVTFSSVSGLYGYGGQSNYGAAKDAIAGFTRVVAKDLAPSGVTANVISPGAHTRMTDSVPDSTRAMRKGEFLSPPAGAQIRCRFSPRAYARGYRVSPPAAADVLGVRVGPCGGWDGLPTVSTGFRPWLSDVAACGG